MKSYLLISLKNSCRYFSPTDFKYKITWYGSGSKMRRLLMYSVTCVYLCVYCVGVMPSASSATGFSTFCESNCRLTAGSFRAMWKRRCQPGPPFGMGAADDLQQEIGGWQESDCHRLRPRL